MRFTAQRAAALIVDLQRAFCHPDGSVAAQGRDISACRSAAAGSLELVAAARQADVPIIWTRLVYRQDYTDGGLLMRELRPGLAKIGALRAGSEDAELIAETNVQPTDYLVDKQRYSAFYATCLEALLRSMAIDSLLVGGVTTSMCVESTVRDAAQRDYRTFVIIDACGDFDRHRHDASLAAMEFGFAACLRLEEAKTALTDGSAEFDGR